MPPLQSLHGISTVSPAGTGTSHTTPPIIATSAEPPPTSLVLSSTTATPFDQSSGVNASMLCNLLPNLGQARESASSAGIYVGEGLLPVPAKLAENITWLEFVEMAELLPEFWSLLTAKELAADPTMKQGITRRRRTVTDIATWIQFFQLMLASCLRCILTLSLSCLPTSFSFFGPARTLGELPG